VAVDADALLKALKRALIFAPKGPKAGARLPVLLRLGGAANPEPTLEDPDAESLVVAAESGTGGEAAGGAVGAAVERVPSETLKAPDGALGEVPFAIALNGQYLSDALKACAASSAPAEGPAGSAGSVSPTAGSTGRRVVLKLNGPTRPAVVAPGASGDPDGGGDSFAVVVMPMNHAEARAAEAKIAQTRAAKAHQAQDDDGSKEEEETAAAPADQGAEQDAESAEKFEGQKQQEKEPAAAAMAGI
jgi:hypothetical protein